jgi:hypothetical protein
MINKFKSKISLIATVITKNNIKKLTLSILIPKLLKKKSEQSIPRSGEEGKSVDCYSIYFDDVYQPKYMVTNYNKQNKEITLLEINNDVYSNEKKLKLGDILDYKFRVNHYYGLYDLKYTNLIDLLISYFLLKDKIKVIYLKLRRSISQALYNQRKLFSKGRVDLLTQIFDLETKGAGTKPTTFNLANDGYQFQYIMSYMYGLNWHSHPQKEYIKNFTQKCLESLVFSEDLEYKNGGYRTTGKALQTIENYNSIEEKHNDSRNLQKKVVYLTAFLALFALVQSFDTLNNIYALILKKFF